MRRGDDLRTADVVREHAARRGDAVALRAGDRALTYAELDERSSRLAQALLASGVEHGSRVAYLDRTAPEVVELLFAAAKIGAVTVPLNWRLAGPEVAAVLDDSRAPLLIAGPEHAALARDLVAERAVELVLVEEEYEPWLAAHEPVDPGHRGEAGDVVVQMYTSGTTGVPKGVLTTHRNLTAAAETSPLWQFDGASVSLTPLPMFHIGGIGWVYCGLWNGASTIIVRDFDAPAILDLLEQRRVTNAIFVPTMLQMLLAVPGAESRDFATLRSIAYGASPITTPLLKAAHRTFGCSLFGCYGLTETTGTVVALEPEDHDPGGPREHLLRSVGRPYPWVELRIVDPATGEEVGAGRHGEVWLRAPNVCAGYFNRPQETAAALTGDGWLRTGDGGYRDEEGFLFLTDRIKDMIVSGGENVYPIEVEEALAQHAAVADVTVIGVPHERWGEAVAALVIRRDGSACTAEELKAFARERLAGYKLPRIVEFVDEFPRTPTGKVRKRELRERYAERASAIATGAEPAVVGPFLAEAFHDERWRDCSVALLAGGYSNLTYAVRSGAGEVILRRPPLGHVLPTAHDMGREYRVMTALRHSAVPVPRTLLLAEADSPLGFQCLVMERVAGHICRTSLPAGYADEPAARRAIGLAIVDVMADLHRVDFDRAGLGDFGRPDGFMERQLRRWCKQWEASKSREIPALDRLLADLAATRPPSAHRSIVHGDYRLDNTILHPARTGEIVAVLDWELSTLGDPLADLGALLAYWSEAADDDVLVAARVVPPVTAADGFPTREDLVGRYAERTGFDLSGLGWYVAFSYVKIAIICQGIADRVAHGAMVGDGFEEAGTQIDALVTAGSRALTTSVTL